METSGDEANLGGSSEGSITSNDSFLSSRPKKFTGAQSTWRQFTHEERLVSNTLTLLRNQNLSIHLYNAHAMKRRLYIPEIASKKKLDPWARKVRTPSLQHR